MFKAISLEGTGPEFEEASSEFDILFAELDNFETELCYLISDHLTPELEIEFGSENNLGDLYKIINSRINKSELKKKLLNINESIRALWDTRRIEDDLPPDLLGVYRNINDLADYRFKSTFSFRGKLKSTNGKVVKDEGVTVIEWNYKPNNFFIKDFVMRTEFEVWNYGQIFSFFIILLIILVLLIQKFHLKKQLG